MQHANRFEFHRLSPIRQIGKLLIIESAESNTEDRVIAKHLPRYIRERLALVDGMLRVAGAAFALDIDEVAPRRTEKQEHNHSAAAERRHTPTLWNLKR